MHIIEVDTAAHLLRIKLTSFWTQETFDAFESELGALLRQLGWKPGSYDCLLDVRERGVQSQQMSDTVHRSRHAQEKALQPRRFAILVSSALVRMQAARVNPSTSTIFVDEGEALEWLAADASID